MGTKSLNEVVCPDGGVMHECYKDSAWGQVNVRTIPAGTDKPGHVHRRKDEMWVLFRGELAVDVEGVGEVRLRQWDALPVPAGTGHAVLNHGPEEAVVVYWSSEVYDPADPDKEPWTP